MRRAFIDVSYRGISITDDISEDIISFSYTDNADGSADDISLSLHDKSKKWINDWMPQKTDSIKAKIITSGMGESLDCGKFLVDDVSFSGSPNSITIKAISIPVDTGFSEVNRNKTWQNATLKDIAFTMANNSNIPLEYETHINPTFKFISQNLVTDKHFLYDLCQKNGLYMKLYNDRIVIYNPQDLEQSDIYMVITEDKLLNWSFNSTLTEAGYTGCSIQYTDVKTGEKIEYTYKLKNASSNKIYNINEKADDLASAERMCKARLRTLNRGEVTGSLGLPGNANLIAGVNVLIKGFGNFDGKYFVDKASHTVNKGYTTSIDIHLIE